MPSRKQLIKKGNEVKRESKYVDFKEEFDLASKRDWCEIIKDIVAMANSGGGIIIFGVKDNGQEAGRNLREILNYDSADITNKINKYTGSHFADFDILEIKRGGSVVVAMVIGAAYPPLVFIKPGAYSIGGSEQSAAFAQGTLYVRHGAKSEPATSADLESILEREILKRKSNWLGNIRQIMKAPANQVLKIVPHDAQTTENESAQAVRLTDDEKAPSMRIDDESLFKRVFKNDTKEVADKCRELFTDFRQNNKFYDILKSSKQDRAVYRVRYLDVENQKGGQKGYYSDKVFEKLEKHYKKKKNSS
jgi:hypothetical protein